MTFLPSKGKFYRTVEAGAKLITNRVDIDDRSVRVDLKEEIGLWGRGDTVCGQNGYLVTLTECVSKVLLRVLGKNKTKRRWPGRSRKCSNPSSAFARPSSSTMVVNIQVVSAPLAHWAVRSIFPSDTTHGIAA